MKTRFFLRLILINFILFLSPGLIAQKFDSALKKLSTDYKQEKLYLHFDKEIYNPGESIWFKAYLFADNFPSLISKTLYTELIDAKGKILQRKTAPVLVSSAAAQFDIPADFTGNVVYVRAYTKWMLNFDSAFLYTKAITISSAKNPNDKTLSSLKNTVTPKLNQDKTQTSEALFVLKFFPEGGDLVQGIESRVAFKATGRFGFPMNINGDIIDNKGKKIESFTSVHDGMGTFLLQPQAGEQYKAVWKDAPGQIHETILPVAKQNGLVLEVNSLINQIEFKIKRSEKIAAPYPYVFIVAQINQQLLYKAKASFSKSISPSGIIPIDNLPAGIVQLTLFTPDEQPIAERITFINPSGFSFITDLNSSLKDSDKRKKNVIQIDVPDTLSCNLSVAVTDADINSLDSKDNIFSHLLLTDDIKGYVHDPGYYFSSDADSVANHLDLVMMTNGWRRFKWEDVLASHFPKLTYMPENYLSINGQIVGLSKSLLANREINGIFELKNGNRSFMNAPIQNSQFTFAGLIFYDTAKIFYQFNNDKNKVLTSRASFDIKNNLLKDPLHLQPDSSLSLSLEKPDIVSLKKNEEIYKEQTSLLESQKIKTLKTVVITSRKKSKQELMDEEYASGFFSGGDSRNFLPEDDPAFLSSQSVLSYLQSRVAGLQINLSSGTPSITWRGSPTTLFMNEIQTDADQIITIPMSDVAMVKVYPPPFFGAAGGGAGGAIAVYLKKGATGNQLSKGLDFATVTGYSPVKEFYSPDYSKTDQPNDPDFRTTLYWNPFVITDKNHRRIVLSFYNNDITKRMKIIIEGCNEDGRLTRIEKIFK